MTSSILIPYESAQYPQGKKKNWLLRNYGTPMQLFSHQVNWFSSLNFTISNLPVLVQAYQMLVLLSFLFPVDFLFNQYKPVCYFTNLNYISV